MSESTSYTGLNTLIRTGHVDANGDIVTPDTTVVMPAGPVKLGHGAAPWVPRHPQTHDKYSIIYADPTWDFKVWSDRGAGRSASQHYKITPLEELKKLDVAQLAAKDSLLYMWVTSPNMEASWELMHEWGFKFATVGFYWVKLNKRAPIEGWTERDFFMGCGYYTRKNVEQVWIGRRGNGVPRVRYDVRELVISSRGEHSVKPAEVAERIVQLHGNVPRLEMFARDKKPGWDVWGDEVRSDVVIMLRCENV